jgi:hypothetical protein
MGSSVFSNKVLWEEYSSFRARDFLKPEPFPGMPNVSARDFLYDVMVFWERRYYSRHREFRYMADQVAKDLLIARTRARNARYSTLPDVSAEQIAYVERIQAVLTGSSVPPRHFKDLDVDTFLDIPSYGPSFISVWEDAKRQGYSHEQIAESIWNWSRARPRPWDRQQERKAKKQPLIDRKLTRRLAEVSVWRQTGEADVPWDADVKGHLWQVRLNDFPDDYMYTLLIDGEELGDFHDWPQAWDRGEPKPEVVEKAVTLAARVVPQVDAKTLLSRYQGGQYESVWRDLVALGPEARKDPYTESARSVAQETMRRAAHNIALLVQRLRQLDYRFDSAPESVLRQCTKDERKLLVACERKRFWIPLSMRAFLEEVGMVCLLGVHPALNPVNDQREALFLTDPLEFTSEYNLGEIFEEWSESAPAEREPVSWMISADAQTKVDILKGEQAEDFYTAQLPNAAADTVLNGESHEFTFVEYLRFTFQWGGFPGWEKYENRPEKELAFLKQGLMPL